MQWIPHLPCAQVSPLLFSVCIRQERLGCTGITNDLQVSVAYNHSASLKLSFNLRPRLLGNRLYQKYCWLLHLEKSMANHALTLKAQKWQTSLLVTFHWLNHVTWLSLMSQTGHIQYPPISVIYYPKAWWPDIVCIGVLFFMILKVGWAQCSDSSAPYGVSWSQWGGCIQPRPQQRLKQPRYGPFPVNGSWRQLLIGEPCISSMWLISPCGLSLLSRLGWASVYGGKSISKRMLPKPEVIRPLKAYVWNWCHICCTMLVSLYSSEER